MMPDVDGTSEWDFITLVAWWNLYGLPVLLAAVAVFTGARNRYRAPLTSADDGALALSYCGYIHFALAIRALMHLTQELLTLRVMGIPQSFPVVGLLSPAVSVLVDSFLGLGLLRRRRAARWCAIAWYLFWSSIAVYVIRWLWHNNVPFDPAAWPDHVVSYGLTVYLLGVMFVPRVRRVFVNQTSPAAEVTAPAWPALSMPTLLCLIIVISTLAVDAADWAIRLVGD
jgi:hypothetical protein